MNPKNTLRIFPFLLSCIQARVLKPTENGNAKQTCTTTEQRCKKRNRIETFSSKSFQCASERRTWKNADEHKFSFLKSSIQVYFPASLTSSGEADFYASFMYTFVVAKFLTIFRPIIFLGDIDVIYDIFHKENIFHEILHRQSNKWPHSQKPWNVLHKLQLKSINFPLRYP